MKKITHQVNKIVNQELIKKIFTKTVKDRNDQAFINESDLVSSFNIQLHNYLIEKKINFRTFTEFPIRQDKTTNYIDLVLFILNKNNKIEEFYLEFKYFIMPFESNININIDKHNIINIKSNWINFNSVKKDINQDIEVLKKIKSIKNQSNCFQISVSTFDALPDFMGNPLSIEVKGFPLFFDLKNIFGKIGKFLEIRKNNDHLSDIAKYGSDKNTGYLNYTNICDKSLKGEWPISEQKFNIFNNIYDKVSHNKAAALRYSSSLYLYISER